MSERRSPEARILAYFEQQSLVEIQMMYGLIRAVMNRRLKGEESPQPKPKTRRKRSARKEEPSQATVEA